MVKFEHFDHAKLWKHTQHDIIYNLMGFVGDYVTESLGQNPKLTLSKSLFVNYHTPVLKDVLGNR